MSIFQTDVIKESLARIDWRNIFSWVTAIIMLVFVAIMIVVGMDTLASRLAARKDVICPSYLSIARSPRDTLIVMRNEPLCNDYVLEHLK